jgi:hypothetical protein
MKMDKLVDLINLNKDNVEIRKDNDNIVLKTQVGNQGTMQIVLTSEKYEILTDMILTKYTEKDIYSIKVFLDSMLGILSRHEIVRQLQAQSHNMKTVLQHSDTLVNINIHPNMMLKVLNENWCSQGHYYNKYFDRCSCDI